MINEKRRIRQKSLNRKSSEKLMNNNMSTLSNAFKKRINNEKNIITKNSKNIPKYNNISNQNSNLKTEKQGPIIPSYNYYKKTTRKKSENNSKKKIIKKINSYSKDKNRKNVRNMSARNKRINTKEKSVEEMIDKFLGKYDLDIMMRDKKGKKQKNKYVIDNDIEIKIFKKEKKFDDKNLKIEKLCEFKTEENVNKVKDFDIDINNSKDKNLDKDNDIKDSLLDLIFQQYNN